MRILVISDIHANYTALEAVIAANAMVDAVWCLGDLVGYGPDPNECIERVKTLPNLTCLLGNHDAAVSGTLEIDKFNKEAADAILWTKTRITPINLEFLQGLQETRTASRVTLAHGSLRSPVWEYILDPITALMNFNSFDTQIALVGHTHLPLCFVLEKEKDEVKRTLLKSGEQIKITQRTILNPGSVGQPRDHDPRASFGILDLDKMTWRIRRIEYKVDAVQKRIIASGLPEKHAQRLSEGW